MSTENNWGSCHPSTVINNTHIAIVTTVLDEDGCITVRELEVGMANRKRYIDQSIHHRVYIAMYDISREIYRYM